MCKSAHGKVKIPFLDSLKEQRKVQCMYLALENLKIGSKNYQQSPKSYNENTNDVFQG